MINSMEDATSYWFNTHGEPCNFTSFNELMEIEIELSDLKSENEKLKHEIKNRNIESMNEYKINRAIELHFLTEVGEKYINSCIEYVTMEESKFEKEYDRDFSEF